MTNWEILDLFLMTDPQDVGCEHAARVLHIYVDLVAAGENVADQYQGVRAHLSVCGPCAEDCHGLLAAVTSDLA
jgi:hypothetical protein